MVRGGHLGAILHSSWGARSATWTVGSRLARFFCEILASEGWGVEELEQVAFRILQFLVGDSDHAVLVTCICDDLDPRQSAATASISQDHLC